MLMEEINLSNVRLCKNDGTGAYRIVGRLASDAAVSEWVMWEMIEVDGRD